MTPPRIYLESTIPFRRVEAVCALAGFSCPVIASPFELL
jgi:hypothetical protein